MNDSWMWQQNGVVWGLRLDPERSLFDWYDGVGCACSGSFATQTVADFQARGPRLGQPPADVLGEIEAAIRAMKAM